MTLNSTLSSIVTPNVKSSPHRVCSYGYDGVAVNTTEMEVFAPLASGIVRMMFESGCKPMLSDVPVYIEATGYGHPVTLTVATKQYNHRSFDEILTLSSPFVTDARN